MPLGWPCWWQALHEVALMFVSGLADDSAGPLGASAAGDEAGCSRPVTQRSRCFRTSDVRVPGSDSYTLALADNSSPCRRRLLRRSHGQLSDRHCRSGDLGFSSLRGEAVAKSRACGRERGPEVAVSCGREVATGLRGYEAERLPS